MRLHALVPALVAGTLASMPAVADIPPPYEPYGIGLSLREAEPYPVAETVKKGGPAAGAGLQAGDAVIAVDGSYSKGIPLYYLEKLTTGRAGTTVELVVLRNGRQVIVVRIKRTDRGRR